MTNINDTELKIHKIQKEILHKLSTTKSHKFNNLLIEGLSSEHMNYHLKKLISFGLVDKNNSSYRLTDKGKDYANSLDDVTKVVEKQPKIAVIIHAVRKNELGEIEYLLNKRLEHPYFGKVGYVGGKVRFGETTEEAARRELYEETGLMASDLTLERIYRKMRKRDEESFVQDVIFYIYFTNSCSGELIEKTTYQENFWISKKEFENRNDLDAYDDLTFEERFEPLPLVIEESINIADGY